MPTAATEGPQLPLDFPEPGVHLPPTEFLCEGWSAAIIYKLQEEVHFIDFWSVLDLSELMHNKWALIFSPKLQVELLGA